jgi:glutamate formiminotransferase/formiminotetrahydrofolate cyclodeaminase
MKLVECVPNFSEGRDKDKIDSIVNEIKNVSQIKILDIYSGYTTNRTVITFIGTPESIKIASFNAIKKASEIIDMRFQRGVHPRIGAIDVCPFVPIVGVNMEICNKIAREVGKKVGEELRIPVYLYAESATKPERRNLANIRKGEYEGLKEKLKDPKWVPDFGPCEFNPKTGATVIGARNFLIAFNINLDTTKKEIAEKIASRIRESGAHVKTIQKELIRIPGKLKAVRAIGWFIKEFKRAQVSINLLDYKITPLHTVFEEVKKEAEKLGARVTGSEIIGLVPKEAILEAGRFYLSQNKDKNNLKEEEIIQYAIYYLGLNDISEFNPKKKILEYNL